MSQENVELVRWLVNAFNERDIEGYVSKCHPDLEFVPAVITRAEGGPENAYRGVDGFRRWLAETEEVMAEFQIQVDEYREVDDERVLLLGTIVGTGQLSGAETHSELGQVFTIRGGRLVSYRGYLDRAEALAAVGPAE